jgi:nucleoside-diphosphate-sugar epimerase
MALNLFITGATGYIGGSVLTSLLQYPNKYRISALVRSQAQADVLKKFGVEPVLGSLDDLDTLTKAASEAHIVVNTADADHLPSAQALVKGLKLRKDKNSVFLHTSGTGLLTFSNSKIDTPFDDSDIERIHSIPLDALHKDVDSWIFENTDDLTAAIIAPSTINGIGSGFFKKTSQQVINLARAAVARGKAGWAGDRTEAIWNNVNINDLADLYILIIDGLVNRTADYGKKGGWYFGAVHEHTWTKIAESLAVELQKLGLVKTTELSQFESEYREKFLYGEAAKRTWTGDSRAVSTRSYKLGWKPSRPDVYHTLAQEVQYLYQNGDLNLN